MPADLTTQLTLAVAKDWLSAFADAFIGQEDFFTDLDRRAGDGDFGHNVSAALRRALPKLNSVAGASPVTAPFSILADTFSDTGGTSGPLFASWFRCLAAIREPWDTAALGAAMERGLERITVLGGAKVGDKTMVDAIAPAVIAVRESDSASLAAAVQLAATAARAAAESTANLVACRGRASYLNDATLGTPDPGACAIALFFESFANPGA